MAYGDGGEADNHSGSRRWWSRGNDGPKMPPNDDDGWEIVPTGDDFQAFDIILTFFRRRVGVGG